MAPDCYRTALHCRTGAQEIVSSNRKRRPLQLFPATAPLEELCMDLLGELPRTPRGHRYLLVITDRYTKLTSVVPMKSISAFEVARAFVSHWVACYGAPSRLITDNGSQFQLSSCLRNAVFWGSRTSLGQRTTPRKTHKQSATTVRSQQI